MCFFSGGRNAQSVVLSVALDMGESGFAPGFVDPFARPLRFLFWFPSVFFGVLRCNSGYQLRTRVSYQLQGHICVGFLGSAGFLGQGGVEAHGGHPQAAGLARLRRGSDPDAGVRLCCSGCLDATGWEKIVRCWIRVSPFLGWTHQHGGVPLVSEKKQVTPSPPT